MPEAEKIQNIIWGIREIKKSPEELFGMLDKKELYLPKLQQITSDCRKAEWLSIRVLLKELLNEEKKILYTETGKPYFADNSFQISISHTKGYVAVALHKDKPVGIDIEYISPRIKKIRDKFLSEDEITNIDPNNEIIHLLLHWSAKESIFKALVQENVDFRENIHIEPFKPIVGIFSSFSAYETRTKEKKSFLVYYKVTSDYVLTCV